VTRERQHPFLPGVVKVSATKVDTLLGLLRKKIEFIIKRQWIVFTQLLEYLLIAEVLICLKEV
jgi:hypothetical protein